MTTRYPLFFLQLRGNSLCLLELKQTNRSAFFLFGTLLLLLFTKCVQSQRALKESNGSFINACFAPMGVIHSLLTAPVNACIVISKVKKSPLWSFSRLPLCRLRGYQQSCGVVLVDVRTKEEFEGRTNRDFGSLKGNINIPIIVRLQGTNAEEAKKLIDESGLKVQSAIQLSEAAALVKQAVA